MRRQAATPLVGDAASFYLPYVDEFQRLDPDCRFVCLERPKAEVVAKFAAWLDRNHSIPMNHWTRRPGSQWHHDPCWTRIYPQYELTRREDCLGQYWEEYAAEWHALTNGKGVASHRGLDWLASTSTPHLPRPSVGRVGVSLDRRAWP
jgi:hypothetical protein